MNKIVGLIILYFVCSASGWRIFHRGRERHGSLGSPSTPHKDEPPELWFEQRLDHFDHSNLKTWKQKYYVNDTSYEKEGPVFLMIGGEGALSSKWMIDGTWLRYARKFKALAVSVEHRFYGKSHPTEDLSTKNLAFLSSQQALADLALFITSFSSSYGLPTGTKWITFGGSYPGSLSAWMRLKYPHLVHAAVSTSGPLLAISDFKDYFKVVEEALLTDSQECVDAVQAANDQFSNLLSRRTGQRSITSLFKLCDSVEGAPQEDLSNLYESIADNFAGIVQYNKDNRNFGGTQNKNPITIDTICQIMKNESIGTEVDRLAAFNSLLLNEYNETCLDYKYDKMVANLRNFSWESEQAEGGRQWTYQTCTEFGFFQTSALNITQELFGDKFPVDFFIKQCADIYGDKFSRNLLEQGIAQTNVMYGAFDNHVGNVVYVHGSIDPWHALGITKTLRDDAPAIYIEGTAHCAEMYPASPDDLPQLTDARNQIEDIIGEWLDENDINLNKI